jgi:hypothetical protein
MLVVGAVGKEIMLSSYNYLRVVQHDVQTSKQRVFQAVSAEGRTKAEQR